jgi:hypothetical protein
MKLAVGHKNYIVVFRHFVCGLTAINKKKQRFCTTCLILEDRGKDKERRILGKGESKRNPIDILNKNVGKARAMESALKTMPTNREMRTTFWMEFHKNFKIKG